MVGFAILAGVYVVNRPTPVVASRSQASNQVAKSPETKPSHIGLPARLQIADIAVNVAITAGTYNPITEDWSVASDTAQYATDTPPVNDGAGTTLLYGHNNKLVFMPLFSLTPGTLATVITDDGQIFTYRFDTSNDVAPSDSQALKNNYAPTMKLLTCSGPEFSRRTLFSFSFVKWEAA
ncbi:sortase [Polaromonas sp.]|nr:sortase [Candidatus Saccharibacteria bacterium]